MFEVQYIAWEIESRCNLGCLFCYSSSWNQQHWQCKEVNIPTLNNIDKGLEKLQHMGVRYINWTGGEPLLREKQYLNNEVHRGTRDRVESLGDILRISDEIGINNILSTNGYFSVIFPGNKTECQKRFWEFLERIDPYLFFFSVSWDAGDQSTTNQIMRIKDTYRIPHNLKGTVVEELPTDIGWQHASKNYEDLKAIADKIREDRFHFNFKVNTLVTGPNKEKAKLLLHELKDIPCIWKLTQFNPRESPPEFRELFGITREEFFRIYHEISLERELLRPAAKCVMASRLYDGEYDPYCFLVINSNGEILLPLAEEHILLGRLYGNDVDSQSCEQFKLNLEDRLYQKIKQLKRREPDQENIIGGYSQYFGDLNPEDKDKHLDKFSEMNQRIANSAYNNSRFLDVKADLNINKLAKASREFLANLKTPHMSALVDAVSEKEYDEQVDALSSFFPITSQSEKEDQIDEGALRATKLKFLYEQETVARVLESSLGIIGGSFVILSKKDKDYRITPFLQRAPYGLHFPWLFDELEHKRSFYKSFFTSIEEKPIEKRHMFRVLILNQVLPLDVLRFVMATLKIPQSCRTDLEARIQLYLSNEKIDLFSSEWLRFAVIIPLILNGCVERVASLLQQVWVELAGEAAQGAGAESDPLFRIFYNEDERGKYLSPVEREINVMIISAEEAIYVVNHWLTDNHSRIFGREDQSHLNYINGWNRLYENNRVERWMLYQRSGNESLVCSAYNAEFRNAAHDIYGRVAPIYWLYLLNHRKSFSPKREYRFELIPHAWFSPYVDDSENGLKAFTGVYFDDLIFKSFWQKNPWAVPESRPAIVGYAHRLNTLLTPLSFYNAHLEMQETVRKVFAQEAKKSAIASVMMRNMSHNIGSHVLSRLTSADNLLSACYEKKYPEGSFISCDELPKYFKKEKKESFDKAIIELKNESVGKQLREFLDEAQNISICLDTASDSLKESANLNSYLKARMDFLADIATSEPLMVTNKYLFQEVLQYFKPQTSGSFTRVEYPFLLVANISGGLLKESEIEIEFGLPDVRVAIPNDLLGAQAFYVILENIIRNCAKHSGDKSLSGNLKLKIELRDSQEYFQVAITDNIGHSETQLNDILSYIDQSVLDTSRLPHKLGKLRLGGWGILEIKLAAAYLRRIPLDQIDVLPTKGQIEYEHHGQYRTAPCILEAELVNDGQNNLQYRFFLEKPKEIAIVVLGESASLETPSHFQQMGLQLIRHNRWDHDNSARIMKEAARDFPIVLLDGQVSKDLASMFSYENIQFRICSAPKLLSLEPSQIIEEAWKNDIGSGWRIDYFSNETKIHIFDDAAGNEEGERQIVFDHHGENEDNNKYFYYEPFGSLSGTYALLNLLIRSKDDSGTYHKLCYEIIDAVRLRFAILDERIQEEAEKPDRQKRGIELNKSLQRMGIFVPPRKDSAGAFDMSAKAIPDISPLRSWIEKISPPPQYVLVHLALIEKIQHSTHTEQIKKWVDQFNQDFNTMRLVVISGRGTPSNLPDGILFLPYSIVSRYILEDRSKFHLAKVLYSTRRRTR